MQKNRLLTGISRGFSQYFEWKADFNEKKWFNLLNNLPNAEKSQAETMIEKKPNEIRDVYESMHYTPHANTLKCHFRCFFFFPISFYHLVTFKYSRNAYSAIPFQFELESWFLGKKSFFLVWNFSTSKLMPISLNSRISFFVSQIKMNQKANR